jgi:hypothetical protein
VLLAQLTQLTVRKKHSRLRITYQVKDFAKVGAIKNDTLIIDICRVTDWDGSIVIIYLFTYLFVKMIKGKQLPLTYHHLKDTEH